MRSAFALVALLAACASPAAAQSPSCENAAWRLHRFWLANHSVDDDAHYHLFHVDAAGRIQRGLGDGTADTWGAVFGYWDDGECGYHMDAYILRFQRRDGAGDSPWTKRRGAWASRDFREALFGRYLGWEPGDDSASWTAIFDGFQIDLVDLTRTWSLEEPDPPRDRRRRRAAMRAAERCVP